MKKYFILIFFIHVLEANNYELKLYDSVLSKIFKKDKISVYSQSPNILEILQKSVLLHHSKTCENADLLIGKNFDNVEVSCLSKPIFATSYKAFKGNKNAFGAFYWRKGRPQIKFDKRNIKRFNLSLPHRLKRFSK
jgi:hypothetical protein